MKLFRAPLAGLTGERRQTDQRRDLAAVEAAEFGQLCQHGARYDRSYARHGLEQVSFSRQSGVPRTVVVDVLIELADSRLESLEQTGDAAS